MTTVARPTRATVRAPRPILRGVLGLVALAGLLVVTIDVATAWRTRHAADRALTALVEPVESSVTARCTLVGIAEVDEPTEEAMCAAKGHTGLPGLDVRLRITQLDGATVACSMTHRRSVTGLLDVALDELSTARRIVDVGTERLSPASEAPFVGLDWDFCGG